MGSLEFFGTLFTILFDIVCLLFVYLFFAKGIAPLGVAIAVSAILGVSAIYLTYRVGKFWINKLKK